MQDIGGRTSLSLVFDPTAAGVRNYIEPFANPVVSAVLPSGPVHTGRRFQNPVPSVDQVVITAGDDARLNAQGLVHVERRSSIRRVTVGGVSGSSIVFA